MKGKDTKVRTFQAIVDTGNNLPLVAISLKAYKALKVAGVIKSPIEESDIKATSADANQIQVMGICQGTWKLYLGKQNHQQQHQCVVEVKSFIVIKYLQYTMNIGICLLQKLGAVLDFSRNVLQIGTFAIHLSSPQPIPSFHTSTISAASSSNAENVNQPDEWNQKEIRAYNKATITIPPHSIAVIKLKTHKRKKKLIGKGDTDLIEVTTDEKFAMANDIALPLNAISDAKNLLLPIVNTSDDDLVIKRISTIKMIDDTEGGPKNAPPEGTLGRPTPPGREYSHKSAPSKNSSPEYSHHKSAPSKNSSPEYSNVSYESNVSRHKGAPPPIHKGAPPPISNVSPSPNSTSSGIEVGNIVGSDSNELSNVSPASKTNIVGSDSTTHELPGAILDEADEEHFDKSKEQKREFILTALKLKSNNLLDTEQKINQVVNLMIKHWRVLDSTTGAMRIGKIKNIKHKILLREDAILSHEKPRPLNPIIREQVEEQLKRWEKQ